MIRKLCHLFSFSVVLILYSSWCPAQFNYPGTGDVPPERFRIVFYNVENLFDTKNDPGRDDDAFTPLGDRRWNTYRLDNKLNNLYRVIAGAGGTEIPAFIGLCEVENRSVLEMLVTHTGLRNGGYKIVHRNSADRRGIDVAVLYRPSEFVLLDTLFIPVTFPFDTLAATRDIVYVKGLAGKRDTLHLFVNHWPSRWGGQAVTEPYRKRAAMVLRSFVDSLFIESLTVSIIIMGDFNDEPGDASILKYLGAVPVLDDPGPGILYNISSVSSNIVRGSYKYQGDWLLFDQFMVSGSLLTGCRGIYATPLSFSIYDADFLLIPDESWFGYKPYRTYEGFRHTGGYSDHLPVILDLWW